MKVKACILSIFYIILKAYIIIETSKYVLEGEKEFNRLLKNKPY